MPHRSASFAIGTTFQNRYQILAELSEGGFGAVYKARQITTGQPVAVKVLHFRGGGAEERQIARFERETQLCGKLHHPNIVRLIDSGQAENGALYTVFEFAPGKSLSCVLAEEGALEPLEAQHLMLQLLDALSCAHAEGVMHRDLKPSNIMIVSSGARRNALVLDFGIGALSAEAQLEGYRQITDTGEVVCTPGYAAPEQLRGLQPTPRSDLFSWGLVFLECLTGRRVFDGMVLASVISRQLSLEPVPLPAALRGHPLGELLRRALLKDVEARDLSAEELLWELEICDLQGLSRAALAGDGFAASLATRAITAPSCVDRRTVSVPATSAGSDHTLRSALDGSTRAQAGARRITAVCCVLCASKGSRGAAGITELNRVLHARQDVVAGIARHFEGHVAGVLGDQVLLCFDRLKTLDDAVRRAALAAVAIRDEIARLDAARSASLDVRLGVHTGAAGGCDGKKRGGGDFELFVGPTPRVAAQLAALAAPGTIVLSEATRRLIDTGFALERGGELHLQGFERPIPVFLLNGLLPLASPRAALLDGLATAEVGCGWQERGCVAPTEKSDAKR